MRDEPKDRSRGRPTLNQFHATNINVQDRTEIKNCPLFLSTVRVAKLYSAELGLLMAKSYFGNHDPIKLRNLKHIPRLTNYRDYQLV